MTGSGYGLPSSAFGRISWGQRTGPGLGVGCLDFILALPWPGGAVGLRSPQAGLLLSDFKIRC